jgi:replicative DNA helicase
MDLSNLNANKDRGKFKRKPAVDLSTMVYGKVPPQAPGTGNSGIGRHHAGKSRDG